MNIPSEIGVIELEDLKNQEIFVSLKPAFFRLISDKIRNYGINQLAFETNISKRVILHWLSEGSLIRLDALFKISDYFGFDFKDEIDYLRGKYGKRLFQPKLPFDFRTEQGVRLIAGILGDGSVASVGKSSSYANTNCTLIDGFIRDVQSVFGDMEFSIHEVKKNGYSSCYVVDYPPLLFYILSRIGFKRGKKVEVNPHIPKFIFTQDDSKKLAFVSQFIDDEGTINANAYHIGLTSACLARYVQCNLLEDIKKLLLSLGFTSSIYPTIIYPSSRGYPRRTWKMQIHGSIQLKKLYNLLHLRSFKKRQSFELMLSYFKLEMFPRKNFITTYLNYMHELQNQEGYFTSLSLANKVKRTVGSSRNLLSKFKKLNLITCTQEYRSGDAPTCARYVVR